MRYFVAVAEELHFHRAAERLHIAQPSLSHQIRTLERQLGVSLFTRTSRSVQLTPAGQVLLDEGREILDRAHHAMISTRRASAEQLTEHSTRDFRIEILAREPRVLALPASHLLSARQKVRFADLRAESFITNPAIKGRPLVHWLAEQHRHGLDGNVSAEAASLQELLALVASGRGVALVPSAVQDHFQRPDISYIPVTDAEPALISIAWRPTKQRPIVDAFINLARLQSSIAA